MMKTLCLLICPLVLGGPAGVAGDAGRDPLAAWRQDVTVAPVLDDANRHSMHTYFNTSPESPDGRWVLFYSSTAPDGHQGDLRVVERATGKVRILAGGVTVEDAHRVACQQWSCGGGRVVFHDLREDRWNVVSVEIASGKQQVLATGRQLGWGQPDGQLVPLYGPHWEPGDHRDLELLDVGTGQIRTAVTADAVKAAYPEWIARQFGDRPISVFFPILSPDQGRVLFKIATPAGGGFRSPRGSDRYGLVCFDLRESRFLYMHPKWGHPAWHPDSRSILNIWSQGPVLIDCRTGGVRSIEKAWPFAGGHPSMAPDGRLFTADTRVKAPAGSTPPWAVVVGDFRSQAHVVLHRFDNAGGATSWRRSHPHPVFSADGRRVYFNVSEGKWTRLYVAQCGRGASGQGP